MDDYATHCRLCKVEFPVILRGYLFLDYCVDCEPHDLREEDYDYYRPIS